MNIVGRKIQSQILIEIKKVVDKDVSGDKFVITRRKKNIDFMRRYGLLNDDIKNIVRKLSVEDCFSGPETDRDPKYEGWIFKFNPIFENEKIYVKIRFENKEKAVCISVHEFGKYEEEE